MRISPLIRPLALSYVALIAFAGIEKLHYYRIKTITIKLCGLLLTVCVGIECMALLLHVTRGAQFRLYVSVSSVVCHCVLIQKKL